MTGINGFSGNVFKDITKGNTIPFNLSFEDSAGEALDCTDWKVYVSFNKNLDSTTPDLEVEIPSLIASSGTFAGSVSDSQTLAFDAGSIYAMLSYVDDSGQHIIVDMAKIRVLNTPNPRVDQT